jgi:hypothetical protein
VEKEVLERVLRAEVENSMVLVPAHEDTEGFAQKVTFLDDELVVEHRDREVSERECQEWFEEHTLLHTWGSQLCHAFTGPLQVRHHLSEGMRIVTLCHTKMLEELTALQAAMTTIVESVLGHSPSDTFRTELVSRLATEFQNVEDHRLLLE